ncbi:MAG: nucleotidyltransferase [Halanaerobiaceae bacterium]
MKITGIITEYNPFHYGHLYHLKKAREITSAEGIVCVLNGNFMQRGEPACTDKWSRTRMALHNGVDLIIELPVIYGIRSAEYFAAGAVKTLAATGVVSHLVFGSETGKIAPLQQAAKIFNQEPKKFRKSLQQELKKGSSFPVAREKAFFAYLNKKPQNNTLLQKTVSEPNNILGIEYIKAIKKYNLPLKPITIKRTHNNYHTQNAVHKLASATAIRKQLRKNINTVSEYVPQKTHQQLKSDLQQGKIPLQKEKLATILLAKLRYTTPQELTKFAEINDGLANRIIKGAQTAGNLKQLISKISTRAYTKTRIKRNLLHILLGIKKKSFQALDPRGITYLRVLGFNHRGEKILSQISQNTTRPIITQPANYLKSIEKNSRSPLKKQLSYDLLATDIYSLLFKKPELRQASRDFTEKIVKID